jgi:tRNA (cmo5U34)-methyltransferase
MLNNADVIITARLVAGDSRLLIGVARAITDGVYCTYLSDLAVDKQYQSHGIGRELMRQTHLAAGGDSKLILLAAPKAASFYKHIGLQPHPSCWIQSSPQQASQRDSCGQSQERVVTSNNPVSNSSSADELADFFDSISGEYAEAIQRCVPRYAEMLWAIFEYLPSTSLAPTRVLELGCGTGNLTELIARNFPKSDLTLVDLSDSSLATCRSRLSAETRCNFICRDFRDLDFPAGHFDLILSTISLHHLNSAEKQRLFAACREWLTPGGVLSYSDQFSAVAADVYEKHMRNWRKYTQTAGASEQEWQMWMEHQHKHDFHDTLPDQLAWLRQAGFEHVDCTWRHLLWTVVQARRT